MSAQIIPFPRREDHDPLVTYAQLERRYDRSHRWVQQLRTEGLEDVGFDHRGRRIFRLSVVEAFLEQRGS